MKIVLLKDIPKVGKKYEVKKVADGYALNRLIPQGLANPATAGNLARLEAEKGQDDLKKKVRNDLLLKNFEDIKGVTVLMTEKANEKGHLFAGIHKEEIIPEIKKQTRLDLDSEHLVLLEPIKEVGEHKITVRVGEKEVVFTLKVSAKG